MRASTHRIRALRWQVRAGSQEEAFVLRQWLRDGLESDLLPAMTEAFDAADPRTKVLHIPRIELRLEIASTDRFLEELADLLRRRLLELLGTAGTVPVEETPSQVRLLAGDESRYETLAHYLETGNLPWSATAPDRNENVEDLRSTAPREVARLVASRRADRGHAERLGETVAFYFRLLQLLPEEDWESVAEAVAAGHPGDPGKTLQQAVAELAQSREGSRFSRLQRAAAFLAAAGTASLGERSKAFESIDGWTASRLQDADAAAMVPGPTSGGEEETAPQRSRRMSERSGRAGRKRKGLERTSEKRSTSSVRGLRPSPPAPLPAAHPDPRERGESLRSALPPSVSVKTRDGAARDGKIAARPHAPLSRRSGRAAGRGAGGEGRRPQTLPQNTSEARLQAPEFPPDPALIPAPTPHPETFPLVVSHAGLILLHPFVPRFFESTGVLEARAVHLPDDMLPRAAALLHRLATGEDEPFELELGFVKILLGLAPEDPLSVSSGLLAESDLEEVEALLQAVIGHWSVLKNTSVAALRQTFLQRRGLVRGREDGIQLQVEPKSFDVLLGHLPWSFAVVKLPWMSKAIYTDWPTP